MENVEIENVEIVLTGRTLPGCDKTRVTAELAALFKTTVEKTAHMLAGRETVIRRELPIDQAPRYLAMVTGTGAEALARPIPQPEAEFPALDLAGAAQAVHDQGHAVRPGVAPVVPRPEPTLQVAPAVATTASLALTEAVEEITCPLCSTRQPKRTLCRSCGANMPQVLAAKAAKDDAAAANPYDASSSSSQYVPSAHDAAPGFFAFDMHGRLNRAHFLAYQLGYSVFSGVFSGMVQASSGGHVNPFVLLVLLPVWWLQIRLAVLRLHDLGRSGKWMLLVLLPVPMLLTRAVLPAAILFGVIGLAALLLPFWPGDEETNEYGAPIEPARGLVFFGAVLYCLLLVVGGIGIISAVAIPSYQKYKHAAEARAAQENGNASTSDGEELRRQ